MCRNFQYFCHLNSNGRFWQTDRTPQWMIKSLARSFALDRWFCMTYRKCEAKFSVGEKMLYSFAYIQWNKRIFYDCRPNFCPFCSANKQLLSNVCSVEVAVASKFTTFARVFFFSLFLFRFFFFGLFVWLELNIPFSDHTECVCVFFFFECMFMCLGVYGVCVSISRLVQWSKRGMCFVVCCSNRKTSASIRANAVPFSLCNTIGYFSSWQNIRHISFEINFQR